MNRKEVKPVISVFCEEREPKKDGTYPIKIRVYWKGKRKYYAIKASDMEARLRKNDLNEFIYSGSGDYSISLEDYNKAMETQQKKGKYKKLREVLKGFEDEAKEFSEQCKPFFTFENFKKRYADNNTTAFSNDLLKTFRSYIKNLNDEGRIRTAVSYGCTLRSLESFYYGKPLHFESVTVEFLKKYDKWMTETGASGKGNSQTTVSINMRQLRTIINQKPEELAGLVYPFGEKKYVIPKSKGRKIALNDADLKKIFSYEPDTKNGETFYFDLWKLAYLLNGANFIDLLNLKSTNINGNFIEFERHKTQRNKSEQPLIKIPYKAQIKEIVEKYNKKNQEYLLPVFNNQLTAEQKDKAAQRTIWSVNTHMKTIAAKLELSQTKVTTYSSRHSFATRLMNLEAPITYISAQLGHTNIATTKAYLDSFNDETIEKWQNKLTDF